MASKSPALFLILFLLAVASGQRARLPQRPNGLYLPPSNSITTTLPPGESEEDIQPGGYTPPPETTTTKRRVDESEEDIQPGGYTPPPTTLPPPPAKKPPPPAKKPESEQQIDAGGIKEEADHAPGMPFDFSYGVKDDRGNDYSHTQSSDGDVVRGEYRTLMADGRMQVVTYTADWKNGYRAIVRYI